LVLGLVVVLAIGCGGSKFAPVSGKVTLDGQPLPNAEVSFQPIAAEGSIEAGVGSSAKTDENGQFTLKTATGQNGAVVGKHVVRISAKSAQVEERDERLPRGGPRLEDKVPPKYNAASELKFEVPAGGTDKADFPLTTK
jgi:hypothetical protein